MTFMRTALALFFSLAAFALAIPLAQEQPKEDDLRRLSAAGLSAFRTSQYALFTCLIDLS